MVRDAPRRAEVSVPQGFSPAVPHTQWLGRKDSNLRIRDPKSRALPLGHAPSSHRPSRHPNDAGSPRSLPDPDPRFPAQTRYFIRCTYRRQACCARVRAGPHRVSHLRARTERAAWRRLTPGSMATRDRRVYSSRGLVRVKMARQPERTSARRAACASGRRRKRPKTADPLPDTAEPTAPAASSADCAPPISGTRRTTGPSRSLTMSATCTGHTTGDSWRRRRIPDSSRSSSYQAYASTVFTPARGSTRTTQYCGRSTSG